MKKSDIRWKTTFKRQVFFIFVFALWINGTFCFALPTPTSTPTATATISTCTYPGSYGSTIINSSNIEVSQYLPSSPVTLSAAATATGISVYLETASGQVEMAVYYDNGSHFPGNLLVQTGSQTAVANAWNTFSLSNVSMPAGTYWLGVALSTTGNNIPGDVTSGETAYNTQGYTFGSLSNPYPTGPTNTGTIAAYISFCSTSPVPTPIPCGPTGLAPNLGPFNDGATTHTYLTRVQFPSASSVTALIAYDTGTTNQYTVGIYGDNGTGTYPTNLLATGSYTDGSSPIPQTISLGNSAIFNSGYEWLAISCDSSSTTNLVFSDYQPTSGGFFTGQMLPTASVITAESFGPALLALGCQITPLTSTPTSTPTNTVTNTPTITQTFTSTLSATNTPTITPTLTTTITLTPTPTDTPTASPTSTNTLTATITPTVTWTNTPIPTATQTVTLSPTWVPPSGHPYVAPNPAPGPRVQFVYTMAESGTAEVKVWNAWGNFVGSTNESKHAGIQSSSLDISSWASGHYFYRVVLNYDSGREDAYIPQILAVKK